MIMPLPARQGHCVTAIRPNGVLLFVEVCSDATPMHCSTRQGRVASLLLIATLQNRLTAGTVSLQLHLGGFALHTGVQGSNINAL